MEPMLIAVTLVALALATAMSWLAWRLWREERRRSAARAAWLAARADEVRGRPRGPIGHEAARERRAAEPLERAPALRAPSLLADEGASAAPHRRLAVSLAVVAMAGAAMLAFARFAGTPAGGEAPQGRGGPGPLALISLGHHLEGDALTVTGSVENPVDGVTLDGVTAVVSAFDAAGGLLASASASLDLTPLPPGARSPFVVTVAGARGVGRYRVGFRGPDGQVLGHVDRRHDRHDRREGELP